ncbi:MAG: hypothetical protein IJ025_06440 [Clostridia bacterium]|nr:hypothetical protein [Clostridia bacterium]
MNSNNYYVDEYSRLVNRITYDSNNFDALAQKVYDKASVSQNDNVKLIIAGVAAVTLVGVGVKFVMDHKTKMRGIKK